LDRVKAFEKSLEWGDRIPIGVIYRKSRQTFEESVSAGDVPSLADAPLQAPDLNKLLQEYL
jgi:2-oxoglutarate ferredoxin oxidoreductase subunit beta